MAVLGSLPRLDIETELRMLRVARALGRDGGISVATSFLGAHAFPAGMDRAAYVELVCGPMLDRVAEEGLADAVFTATADPTPIRLLENVMAPSSSSSSHWLLPPARGSFSARPGCSELPAGASWPGRH